MAKPHQPSSLRIVIRQAPKTDPEKPPHDEVEEASEESFPASDPPAIPRRRHVEHLPEEHEKKQ